MLFFKVSYIKALQALILSPMNVLTSKNNIYP